MDPNKIDFAGLPTTLAIIGAVFLIVISLRTVNRLFPQLLIDFKNATPWMGWVEEDDTEYVPTFVSTAFHSPNRW